ncbi:MAG: bifunctional riboflavin kinase/FAD synthetase [Bacteroidia bacterium]
MKIFRGLKELPRITRPILTVGTFDGVHIGHRQILDRLNTIAEAEQGESMLMTFWPHPRMVLNPDDDSLKLLNTLDERAGLLREAGLKNLLIIEFTIDFSRTTSLEFVQQILVDAIGVHTLVIGYDHHFGKNREGSLEQLAALAPKYGFALEEISAQQIDDVNVSSTKIRKALEAGQIEQANEFLGYSYFLQGTVAAGEKLGRQLGYPTANIQLNEPYKLIPADGVYVAEIIIGNESWYGMLNTGLNPTIEGKGRTIEVHIFNFTDDIYGKEICIRFLYRMRDEIKFESVDELKEQMEADQHHAFELLEKHKT